MQETTLKHELLEPMKRAYAWFLWDYMEKYPRARDWYLFARGKRQSIFLDYPVNARPRYGYGRPPHQRLERMFDQRRDRFRATLESFLPYVDRFTKITTHGEADTTQPQWVNGMLPGLDGVSIYSFLATRNPKRYFEVGSGNSTRFARRAIRDLGLRTRITSVDPQPRVETDAICDRMVRTPLEESDLSIFDELEAGDVLFVDNSHRTLQNSDVTVVFLEVLPNLKPGVLVGIHDICLPLDYGPEITQRYYSEQYMLAVHLLATGDRAKIVLPGVYVSGDAELRAILDPLWKHPALAGVESTAGAFWLET
jgi:hypothetical protein